MSNSIYRRCISICVLFNTAQTANSNLLSIRFCPSKQPSGLYAGCICEFPVCAAAVRCTVVSLAAASYMRMTSYVSRFGWSRLEARRANQPASQPTSQLVATLATLAFGAEPFEFTAKYVAILCFARIWIRQAPA